MKHVAQLLDLTFCSPTTALVSTCKTHGERQAASRAHLSILHRIRSIVGRISTRYLRFASLKLSVTRSTGSGQVFRISYPKGSYSGNSGGTSGQKLAVVADNNARVVSSYQIAFGSQDGQGTFDFVLGGKLPGRELLDCVGLHTVRKRSES